MEEIRYNHNRTLESFVEEHEQITQHGFHLIAVCQMYFEDTFVFETDEEATRAFEYFEQNATDNRIVGWWYGREEFLETVKQYEIENEGYSKVKIHWL